MKTIILRVLLFLKRLIFLALILVGIAFFLVMYFITMAGIKTPQDLDNYTSVFQESNQHIPAKK